MEKIVKTATILKSIKDNIHIASNAYEFKWLIMQDYNKLHNSLDWNELKSAIDFICHIVKEIEVNAFSEHSFTDIENIIKKVKSQQDLTLDEMEIVKTNWSQLVGCKKSEVKNIVSGSN